MRCPACRNDSLRVVDSRLTSAADAVRRRRECDACGHRFTTYERIEHPPVFVRKKDGGRQAFSPDKLRAGMLKALHRRPVPAERIDEFVADVHHRLARRAEREVDSDEIGELVMRFLRPIDAISYIRFASVYREFEDIHELYEEVRSLYERAHPRADAPATRAPRANG